MIGRVASLAAAPITCPSAHGAIHGPATAGAVGSDARAVATAATSVSLSFGMADPSCGSMAVELRAVG